LTVTQEATLVDHGPWKRRWSALLDALLLCVTAVFFYTHGKHAIVDGSFTSVFFAFGWYFNARKFCSWDLVSGDFF